MHAHDCSSALLSHAMAAPPPNLKVAITIHVAFERTVLKYAGLYDDTVTVKSIVDANLAKACESAARSLIFESASTFASAEDMRVPGTLLNAADTAEMTVAHLRDAFGRWLLVRATVESRFFSVYGDGSGGLGPRAPLRFLFLFSPSLPLPLTPRAAH